MPTVRLIKSKVDDIPAPATGQVIYWDETLKGFGLRVTPSRKTYIAEGRVNGRTCRVKIGPHGPFAPDAARDQAMMFLAEMNRGNNPNTVRALRNAESVTLAESYAAFKQSRPLRPKTITIYDDVMRRCFPDWQNKPITSITKNMVEERHRHLSNAHGPRGKGEAQAHQAMRTLATVLNFAAVKFEDDAGQPVISVNPVKRLSEIRAWNRIPRRQSLIQAHQLKPWAEAVCSLSSATARDYLLLLVLTGLRRNEAAALKWSEIDFDAKTLRIPADRTKNHREHRLPLSDYVHDLLRERYESRDKSNPFVFPGTGKTRHMVDPKRQIKQVVDTAEIPFTSHDLRRSFLSIAEALDVSHYALKKLANHTSSSDVTQGYIINSVERLREPMQLVTTFIVQKAELKPVSSSTASCRGAQHHQEHVG